MLRKTPLRMRLTLVSVSLLLLCCLGLTALLNFSANRMADVIEAAPITPATSIGNVSEKETYLPMVKLEVSHGARKTFLNQSIVWMLTVVLAGGVLTYFITGRALKPLNELSGQMKKRTVHNLSEMLPVPESHDEVASLTVSFNEMTGKLGEAFDMQKRFSQSAAHELRTPLTVLKTKLEVFRKKQDRTQEEYDRLIDLFDSQTNRLSVLVKDLLDLTSMDAVELGEEVPLDLLLRDIVVELSELAKERNVALTLDCPELTVRGNKSLLHRAFYNLVENAIKYNKPAGRAEICVRKQNGEITVVIADTGLGVPEEQRTLIFEPFYRVDKSRSRQMGGAGLGLATVKAVLDKHGAQIYVSENPGGGSVFTVIL